MVDPIVSLILTRRAVIHTLGQIYDPGYGITKNTASDPAIIVTPQYTLPIFYRVWEFEKILKRYSKCCVN